MKGVSLELGRMARAMASITQKWDAIHVAGTNGKGSVCTYLSALCQRFKIENGLFTSPYLVEPRDAIKTNGVPITAQKYNQLRQQVLDGQARRQSQQSTHPVLEEQSLSSLTEFEIGTLVAFSAFDDANVATGIVEVGLGGRLDSTNALARKKVTVITKIGLDHQKLLGDTLPLIAQEKAAIMRTSVPCVVDGSNPPEVLDVFARHAFAVGAPLHVTTEQEGLLEELSQSDIMPHQAQNMACAITAFRLAFPELRLSISDALPLLKGTTHLGRLSWIEVKLDPQDSEEAKRILIDGAHNPQSAETLATFVESRVRQNAGQSITWIVAVSKQDGKDAAGMLRTLVRPGDSVVCVAFSRRPTMPWVEPVKPSSLREIVTKLGVPCLSFEESGEGEGRGSLAAGIAEVIRRDGPVVLTGSLYLVGDAYRLYDRSL
ncbi:folylpolyglutamate synthase [Sodiomyces alkalinus F11]|uniref:Folylpolyglutamate synthase n=1 Tax=Sodiomyces alkalinus (strain CBS 110278 / VKM F-3762 / F11) TaxID=1314773 RepID=A0A3N2Q451_SODAK|nr:folylpolyglutamate synthase [Sodiomyces alkalinus F11]ROT41529.1 folylpolyglutamate synthase [Sodiomyces alkalinus F11]